MSELPVIWRAQARSDLAEIIQYIAVRDPSSARRIKTAIETAVLPLTQYPMLFRLGRVPGTRELVAHPNYIIVYRVMADRVEIVNVLHTRRQYP